MITGAPWPEPWWSRLRFVLDQAYKHISGTEEILPRIVSPPGRWVSTLLSTAALHSHLCLAQLGDGGIHAPWQPE